MNAKRFWYRSVDREVDAELAFHIEMTTRELSSRSATTAPAAAVTTATNNNGTSQRCVFTARGMAPTGSISVLSGREMASMEWSKRFGAADKRPSPRVISLTL